jgi:hypothetical protein
VSFGVAQWDENLTKQVSCPPVDSPLHRAFLSTFNETRTCFSSTADFSYDFTTHFTLFYYSTGYSVPASSIVTEDPDDFEEDDDSSEADDDGRVYKNPRNFPSPGKLKILINLNF